MTLLLAKIRILEIEVQNFFSVDQEKFKYPKLKLYLDPTEPQQTEPNRDLRIGNEDRQNPRSRRFWRRLCRLLDAEREEERNSSARRDQSRQRC